MSNDIYICYDGKDQETADKICTHLENSKMSCWIKSRDVAGNLFDEIMKAISNSKIMLLVFSQNTNASNFVKTEVDFAFKNKKSILVYKIDDSEIGEGLDFFLSNQPAVNAADNPEGHFDELVELASKLVNKQKREERKLSYIVKKHKKAIIALAVVIIIAAVLIVAYPMISDNSADSGNMTLNPGDVKLNINDFHVDNVKKKGYSWNYSYYVGGTISPEPGRGYAVSADFYDKTGSLVNTTDTSMDNIQRINDGYLLASEVSGTKNIDRVEVQLIDNDDRVIAQSGAHL